MRWFSLIFALRISTAPGGKTHKNVQSPVLGPQKFWSLYTQPPATGQLPCICPCLLLAQWKFLLPISSDSLFTSPLLSKWGKGFALCPQFSNGSCWFSVCSVFSMWGQEWCLYCSLHVGVETRNEFNGLLLYFPSRLNAIHTKHGKVTRKAGTVAKTR